MPQWLARDADQSNRRPAQGFAEEHLKLTLSIGLSSNPRTWPVLDGRVKPQGIDLVIMGTHGRKGLNRILFGSVAERVIKMSPIPVLSINPYRVPDLEI